MQSEKHFESLYPVDSREQELHDIVEYIKEGNSVQIIGLPGTGRSTIFGLLQYNRAIREKHFPRNNAFVHFVSVNFSELSGRPLEDVTKLMFLNLVESLRERSMHEEYEVTNEMFKEALSMQDAFVIFQGLKRAVEYLAIEKKLTIIYLMDRLEEYLPLLNHDFFSNIRALRNIAKYRFSVIMTLYKPLEDILEPSVIADVHDLIAGHTVYQKLSDMPSLAFRIQYLEQLTQKKLPDDQRRMLLSVTGGHWKLTRLGAEAMLASQNGAYASEEELITFLLQQRTIQGACEEILLPFTPYEKELLKQYATSKPTNEEPLKQYFEKIGLLKDDKLQIPLLAAYLASQKNEERHEPLVFDAERNVIRRGETVLSDSLTASEFRLLSYMLQHPDRVVDRNEVIDIVWKDAKSTEGVTDQAVDQLLFRIRRKIESDPNNPQHLKTVKGRGFEFKP